MQKLLGYEFFNEVSCTLGNIFSAPIFKFMRSKLVNYMRYIDVVRNYAL